MTNDSTTTQTSASRESLRASVPALLTGSPADSLAGASSPVCTRAEIDPRGPRFGASLTSVVLAVALLSLGTPVGIALVAWQALVFGIGAFIGLQAHPDGALYRRFIQPRLGRPTEWEAAAGPRFAQGVGFAFTAIALLALVLGVPIVAYVAVGLALAAALLNAAFGLCLGCEVYLLGRRVLSRA